MADALAPLLVAVIGAAAMVAAGLLARRSGTEDRDVDRDDREKIRLQGEITYLSDRLDHERSRTDALETEVQDCERSRAEDRRRHDARMAAQDERIEHLTATVRRLLPGGPDATPA